MWYLSFVAIAWTLLGLSVESDEIPISEVQNDTTSSLFFNQTFSGNETSFREYLQICAFNVKIFGRKKAGKVKVMRVLAKVCLTCSLMHFNQYLSFF